MNTRLLALSVLVMLVIVGLIAGLFTNSIQKALTLPVMQSSASNVPVKKSPVVLPTPTITMPAQRPTVAKDTFQRANQPLWGTASDGSVWGSDANNSQVFSIVNKKGQIAKGSGTFNALLGPKISDVDVVLDGSVNHFDGVTNLGAVIRWTDSNNFYKMLIDGTHLTIIKHVKGIATQIKTTPFNAQGGVAYTLHFRTVGTTIFANVWRSGTVEPNHWMVTVTDASFTIGQAGVRVVLKNGIVINILSFVATTVNGVV